jgi:hypothetical protein
MIGNGLEVSPDIDTPPDPSRRVRGDCVSPVSPLGEPIRFEQAE